MEPPAGQDPEAIRDRKAELVRAMAPLRKSDVVRGQFRGYRKEAGVAKNSTVETFAALRLSIPTWRWAGVPFLIRVGKCLPETVCEVVVGLNPPPVSVFRGERRHHNTLRFRVQPDIAIGLGARIKKEGKGMVGEDVELVVQESPADDMPPYERLLGDALNGDAGLFARQDYVEAAWRVVDPILGDATPVHPYDPGTWGPEEANTIPPRGDIWHDPDPPAS
jgi:glucose-6-phosphate 1-dehydrogenase